MPDYKAPEKKKKKPKHTRLVVPGAHSKAPRQDTRWAFEDPDAAYAGPETALPAAEGLPDNAIPLPVGPERDARGRRVSRAKSSPARRRRRRRRVLLVLAAALALAAILVLQSGVYLTAGSLAGDWFDNLRIGLSPGEGFPAAFPIEQYLAARPTGAAGFALLGQRDLTFVSATGKELRRVQHSYATPGFSAGKARAVLYNRGGREYTVEGRSKTLATRSTEQDILFARLSPDGWLALATTSRYRATLTVLGPTYDGGDPLLVWPLVDEKPLLAAFRSDNRHLLLGCLSTVDGAASSSIYLLRTDRAEVQQTIREPGALLLQAEYLDDGKVLAVFDGFTAIYDSQGRAIVRYDHGGRQLLSADICQGHVALAFGSASGLKVEAVLLGSQLEPLLTLEAAAGGEPQVLAGEDGLVLLAGRELAAQGTAEGTAAQTLHYEDSRPVGLAHGPEPLVLTHGGAEPLKGLLKPGGGDSTSGNTGSGSDTGGGSSDALAGPAETGAGRSGPSPAA